MFTGLIEEVGTVVSLTRRGAVHDLVVGAATILEDMRIGDSVSIAGVCQTVTAFDTTSFRVQAVAETMARSTFGRLTRGSSVNLERALKVGDRLGGHFVQGHVEARGVISDIKPAGEGRDFRIKVPHGVARYIVEKGSVAVDGISLTVSAVNDGEFGISVIPHTIAVTTLRYNRVGDQVNIETDMLAKYVEKLALRGGGLTMEMLNGLGF